MTEHAGADNAYRNSGGGPAGDARGRIVGPAEHFNPSLAAQAKAVEKHRALEKRPDPTISDLHVDRRQVGAIGRDDPPLANRSEAQATVPGRAERGKRPPGGICAPSTRQVFTGLQPDLNQRM